MTVTVQIPGLEEFAKAAHHLVPLSSEITPEPIMITLINNALVPWITRKGKPKGFFLFVLTQDRRFKSAKGGIGEGSAERPAQDRVLEKE